MFLGERPVRRVDADSRCIGEPGLRPADRHARRLGVLGCFECPREPVPLPKARAADGRRVLSRVAPNVVPIAAASCPGTIAAGGVVQFPMVAA